MGLFDLFKNKKEDEPGEKKPENNQVMTDIDRFEKEVMAALPRYLSKPGANIKITARHKETNEVIPFAAGFPEQFEPWRTVKSLADRRGIIYSILDTQIGNQMELWQIIERFNDDRYAERALKVAHDHKNDRDERLPDFWNALARTYFILTRYKEAEQCCLKAMEMEPGNIRTKRIYADLLHVTHRQDKAHELYEEILKEKIPGGAEVKLPLQSLLGFDGDIVNSPIYAIAWLKGDKSINPEAWDWATEEFYYSPHFRALHAYHLIENGEHLKGLVKLLSLTKEMPWFKEAVLNSYKLIDELQLAGQLANEKQRLKSIMDSNNWN